MFLFCLNLRWCIYFILRKTVDKKPKKMEIVFTFQMNSDAMFSDLEDDKNFKIIPDDKA